MSQLSASEKYKARQRVRSLAEAARARSATDRKAKQAAARRAAAVRRRDEFVKSRVDIITQLVTQRAVELDDIVARFMTYPREPEEIRMQIPLHQYLGWSEAEYAHFEATGTAPAPEPAGG